jgi:hypothetical protein
MKSFGKGLPAKKHGAKKEFRKDNKSEVKFSKKSRLDFLQGFSQRKKERQTKGHLKAKRKLMEEKHKDRQTIRSQINKEFTRAQESALKNIGHAVEPVSTQSVVLEDRVVYYEKDSSKQTDGFGDVHVQVTSLESPEFTRLSAAQSSTTEPV